MLLPVSKIRETTKIVNARIFKRFWYQHFVPRKNPVPELEKSIGKRLEQFRKDTGLSRVAFAKKLGIDSALLASYEYGRSPIRFELAKKLLLAFGLSFEWLATGKGDQITFDDISERLEVQIPARCTFSEAFVRFLSPEFEKIRKHLDRAAETGFQRSWWGPLGLSDVDRLSWMLADSVKKIHQKLPPDLADKMSGEIWEILKKFSAKYRSRLSETKKQGS